RLVSTIRGLVRQLDPGAAIDHIATLEQLVSASLFRPRLYARLLGMFAIVAMLLAAVGIVGVTAYLVQQRTDEIGIRMALGASDTAILSLVFKQSALAIGGGIVVGLMAAAASTRILQGMLFGITPLDWLTFLGASIVLLTLSMIATYIPARSATRISPLLAMRSN